VFQPAYVVNSTGAYDPAVKVPEPVNYKP